MKNIDINKKDKVLLAFSGGYDSTYILLLLLQQGHKNISCIYVDIPNNPLKAKIEIKRCKKILKYYNKAYNIDIPFRIVESQVIPFDNNTLYAQPFLFINTIVPVMDVDTTWLLFGFHRVSGIWHSYTEFCNMFTNACALYRGHRLDNRDNRCFIFNPLELEYKSNIVKGIKKYSKKLFKLCWTCEDPTKKNKPCGKCLPCRNLKQALI